MWWSRVHKLSACHIVYAVRKKGPSVVLCTFDSSHSRNVFCRIVTGLKREKVWFYVLAVDVEPSQGFPTVLTDTGGWTWPVNSSVVKVWAMLTVFLWTLALVTRRAVGPAWKERPIRSRRSLLWIHLTPNQRAGCRSNHASVWFTYGSINIDFHSRWLMYVSQTFI